MIKRYQKFLSYLKIYFPDIVDKELENINEETIEIVYSEKVYNLIFDPKGDKMAPLNINSDNIWLKSAALFRLSNPL